MRVGGNTKITVDARIISATLRPLEDEVKAGRFRADLFYRLQGITLHVPPLRERTADIGPLIQQFVVAASTRHDVRPPRISRQAMEVLRAWSWPGNVRELRNTIEMICVLREGRTARTVDLPDPIRRAALDSVNHEHAPGGAMLTVRTDGPLHESVDAIVRAALRAENGNRSRAARRLSVSLRTMQRYAARMTRG